MRCVIDPYEHFHDCFDALPSDVVKKVKEGLKNAGVPSAAEGKFAEFCPLLDHFRLTISSQKKKLKLLRRLLALLRW